MNGQAQTSSTPENELARRVEQLSQLIEVSESVTSQLELDPLLQQIVDTARELVEAELGALLILSEDEKSFQILKGGGWPHEPDGFPSATGIHSPPCRQGVPLRPDDVCSHTQVVGFPPYPSEVGSSLSVPLKRNGRVLGALCVSNAPGGPVLSADDEELLLTFATVAAIAIENARLYARAEELARLGERQRIPQRRRQAHRFRL